VPEGAGARYSGGVSRHGFPGSRLPLRLFSPSPLWGGPGWG
jgi:hypothetical protein